MLDNGLFNERHCGTYAQNQTKSYVHLSLLGTVAVVVVDRFYIALFSALEQPHYARM